MSVSNSVRYLTAGLLAACALMLMWSESASSSHSRPAPAVTVTVTAPDTAPSLNSACAPANRLADVPGDAAYDLTLTNPGTQAVQVTQVAVIFSGANGQELGSDDPAQQDFTGDQEPISSFNTVLIGAGQSVTIPMETGKISGAAGNWTCSLGSWSDS